jgi:hypothetical protein
MKHSNLYLGLVLPSGGWQNLDNKNTLKMKFLNEEKLFKKGLDL